MVDGRARSRGWTSWVNRFNMGNVWLKECGADGNCQFHVVAEAIKPVYTFTAEQLRSLAGMEALYTSDEHFAVILSSYREEKKRGEFQGHWDPDACRTRADFKAALEGPNSSRNGFDFQGDAITLDLLARALQVTICVFNHFQGFSFEYGAPEYGRTICLLYLARPGFHHYQLLGFRGRDHCFYTIFGSALPPPLRAYLDTKRNNKHTKKLAKRDPVVPAQAAASAANVLPVPLPRLAYEFPSTSRLNKWSTL